jgi:transposase
LLVGSAENKKVPSLSIPCFDEEEGTVPQALLPLIPDGATQVNTLVSIVRESGQWTYFVGVFPVFAHREDDRRSFRMFTAQLVCQGVCRLTEIIKTFGVSKNSVLGSVKKYREEGVAAFFSPRRGRGPTVMTNEVTAKAQELLQGGLSRQEVAKELGIKDDTLRKAINQGRLQELPRTESVEPILAASDRGENEASDKSDRSVEDAAAADTLGTACTRPTERVAAAVGLLQGAPTRFETCRDVTFGGVLCALPALTENGLFSHLDACFGSLGGYYTTLQVVTLLADMALCRIKTVEQLQYHPPGELGKLLGLDRVPEVRCLRQKLTRLSTGDAPQRWGGLLSQDWMEASPDLAGALYVDGHVRLYHGQKTELPRRYVARQRLCLRGTTDYWVNDALGQPFFAVQRPVDQGMLEVLQNDIVPRLRKEVPGQPTQEELDHAPYRSRFVILFDREGYSPGFFKEMWGTHRIACVTYHKYPKDDWPEEEFTETPLRMPNGETVSLKLAERGSWIGDRKEGLWVREIRKLTGSGHQVSLISSAYGQEGMGEAGYLFARWSQENFFRYAMEHYAIDLLAEYRTEPIPGTNRPVVNPAWRELESRRRSVKSKLTQRQSRYAAHTLHPEADEAKVKKWEKEKAALLEEIEQLEHEVEEVRQRQKETPRHLAWEALPEEAKFQRLAPGRKQLMDTVKMIAYRAETAMAAIVREKLAREDDARSLLRDLFRSEADILPDREAGTLQVRVHGMSNPRSTRAIQHLLNHLNDAAMNYPGTNLRLVYTHVVTSPE